VLRRAAFAALCGVVPAAVRGVPAASDRFPARQVRIVVPFPPGGGTDLVTRTLAESLSASLQGTVLVENRPGAGTVIGTEAVARSAPDGYTLLMATFAHAVNPALHPDLPYDSERSFTAVSLIGRSPNVLVVNPARGPHSVAALLRAAREQPGRLTYGSFGSGTSAHLAGALFAQMAGVQIVHVPYKGSAPALTDLIAGQIDMMFTTMASVRPLLRSGRLQALALTSAARSALEPGLPTVAEAGVPGYAAESWYGLLAPAGLPAGVRSRLNRAIAEAAASPAFRARIEEEGLVVSAGPPEQFDAFLREETRRWAALIGAAHISAEG
jgi:tripartite-type tricarboxylate transporter receptor subunit TctC